MSACASWMRGSRLRALPVDSPLLGDAEEWQVVGFLVHRMPTTKTVEDRRLRLESVAAAVASDGGPGRVVLTGEGSWVSLGGPEVHDRLCLRGVGDTPRERRHVVEVVMRGPPAYGAEETWALDREVAWARAALEWCRGVFAGESLLVSGRLYREGVAPRAHVFAVPVRDGTWSWEAVRASSTAGARRTRTALARLRASFAERVAAPFGLARTAAPVVVLSDAAVASPAAFLAAMRARSGDGRVDPAAVRRAMRIRRAMR